MAHRYYYTLSERDVATLGWLAARGYDAGLLHLSRHDCQDDCDESAQHIFSIGEVEASVWVTASKNDPAYLTCCGSLLAETLRRLADAVV